MLADSRFLPLKPESVDCVITSPPYWSLRKYDIPDLIWDEKWCERQVNFGDHLWVDDPVPGEKSGKPGPNATVGARFEQDAIRRRKPTNTCKCCGAWRGQLGIEPTIDLYLKHLLQCFDEVWRVLKPTGTLFVNLGDSYGGSWQNYGNRNGKQRTKNTKSFNRSGNPHEIIPPSVYQKAKSLCLIPERFAIEMVNRGWILRNKIIWHKPNCMPASVKDRFTVDFEPVFFFVKSRKYWFEQQYETQSEGTFKRYESNNTIPPQKKWRDMAGVSKAGMMKHIAEKTGKEPIAILPQGRNRRCVWTIPTQPYPESHFATFPEALIEPMIRAGCPVGGIVLDPFCGSGTVMRVAEKLNRIGIGFDLGYQDLQKKRVKNIQRELL